jgi:hypothetical protein
MCYGEQVRDQTLGDPLAILTGECRSWFVQEVGLPPNFYDRLLENA